MCTPLASLTKQPYTPQTASDTFLSNLEPLSTALIDMMTCSALQFSHSEVALRVNPHHKQFTHILGTAMN